MQPISNLIQKDGQAVPTPIDQFILAESHPIPVPQIIVSSDSRLRAKIDFVIDATQATDRFVLSSYVKIATDIMQRVNQCVLILVAPDRFQEDTTIQLLFREAAPPDPIALSGAEVSSIAINRDVSRPKWSTQPRFSDYVLTSVVDSEGRLGLGTKAGSNPFSNPEQYLRTPNAVSVSELLDVARLLTLSKSSFLRWLFEQDQDDDAASSGVCFIAELSNIKFLETPLISSHQIYSVDGALKLNVTRNARMKVIEKVTLTDGTTWPQADFFRIIGHNRAKTVLFINAPLDSVVVSHMQNSLVVYNDSDRVVVGNDEFLYDVYESSVYMGLTQFAALCGATDIVYSRLPTHTIKTTVGEMFTAIAGGSAPQTTEALTAGPYFKFASQEQTTHDWILSAPFVNILTLAFIV